MAFVGKELGSIFQDSFLHTQAVIDHKKWTATLAISFQSWIISIAVEATKPHHNQQIVCVH